MTIQVCIQMLLTMCRGIDAMFVVWRKGKVFCNYKIVEVQLGVHVVDCGAPMHPSRKTHETVLIKQNFDKS